MMGNMGPRRRVERKEQNSLGDFVRNYYGWSCEDIEEGVRHCAR
jgi:hypothetical protein